MKIKLSKSQWELIGKKAGWTPIDPSDFSDADIGPVYDADTEEDILLGKEENDSNYAYDSGYTQGLASLRYKHISESDNPYRVDTEIGTKKFEEWRRGFHDAIGGIPNKFKNPKEYAEYQKWVEAQRKKNFRPDWMEGQPEGFTGIKANKANKANKNIYMDQNVILFPKETKVAEIKKDQTEEEMVETYLAFKNNGRANEKGITEKDVDAKELKDGTEIEFEHTTDRKTAVRIALDHLAELKNYYTLLKKMEEEGKAQGKEVGESK